MPKRKRRALINWRDVLMLAVIAFLMYLSYWKGGYDTFQHFFGPRQSNEQHNAQYIRSEQPNE